MFASWQLDKVSLCLLDCVAYPVEGPPHFPQLAVSENGLLSKAAHRSNLDWIRPETSFIMHKTALTWGYRTPKAQTTSFGRARISSLSVWRNYSQHVATGSRNNCLQARQISTKTLLERSTRRKPGLLADHALPAEGAVFQLPAVCSCEDTAPCACAAETTSGHTQSCGYLAHEPGSCTRARLLGGVVADEVMQRPETLLLPLWPPPPPHPSQGTNMNRCAGEAVGCAMPAVAAVHVAHPITPPPAHPSPLLHAHRWLGAWRGGGRHTQRWQRLSAGLERISLHAVLAGADCGLAVTTPGGELHPADTRAGVAAAWLAESLRSHRHLPRGPTTRMALGACRDPLTAPLALGAWLAAAESQGALLVAEPTKRRRRALAQRAVPCTVRIADFPRVSQRLTFAALLAAHELRSPAAVQQLYAFAHKACQAAGRAARKNTPSEQNMQATCAACMPGTPVPHEWGGLPVAQGAPPPLHPSLYEVTLRSAVVSGDVEWAQVILADMRLAHVVVSEHAQVQVLALLRQSARRSSDQQGGGSGGGSGGGRDAVRRGERLVSSAMAAHEGMATAAGDRSVLAKGGLHHLHTSLATLQLDSGQPSDAVSTLERMFRRRQHMTRSEYAALLSVHASQCDLHAAQTVLATMRGAGLAPGAREFTTAMKAALPSNPRAALEMMDVFLAEGGTPDNAVYTQVMTAAHYAGDADAARQLHLLLCGPPKAPSPLEGDWDERGGVRNPFPPLHPPPPSPELLSSRGLLLNERLFGSLLGVFQRAQQPGLVTDALLDALSRGVVPGVVCTAQLVGGHPRKTHEDSKYADHFEMHGWHSHCWVRCLAEAGVLSPGDAGKLQSRLHASRGCSPGLLRRLLGAAATRHDLGGSTAVATELFDAFFGVKSRFQDTAVMRNLAELLWSPGGGGLRRGQSDHRTPQDGLLNTHDTLGKHIDALRA